MHYIHVQVEIGTLFAAPLFLGSNSIIHSKLRFGGSIPSRCTLCTGSQVVKAADKNEPSYAIVIQRLECHSSKVDAESSNLSYCTILCPDSINYSTSAHSQDVSWKWGVNPQGHSIYGHVESIERPAHCLWAFPKGYMRVWVPSWSPFCCTALLKRVTTVRYAKF